MIGVDTRQTESIRYNNTPVLPEQKEREDHKMAATDIKEVLVRKEIEETIKECTVYNPTS